MKPFDDRPDWSAEERYISRSVKYRKHVLLWMDSNVGEGFHAVMEIAEVCANDYKKVPFSSLTAYRWINQFSASNAPFFIGNGSPTGDGKYSIGRRRKLRAEDFRRWGIPVPKRFRK